MILTLRKLPAYDLIKNGYHFQTVPSKYLFPSLWRPLPKSGTTSVHTFFRCGRLRSVHTYCPKRRRSDRGMVRLGVLMQQNAERGIPTFLGCGDNMTDRKGPAKVFTDVGYAEMNGGCYYPSYSSLDALYQSYPNMTIMLGTRNSSSWYYSLQQWHGGSLMRRWTDHCDFMQQQDSMEAFTTFYETHNDRVRQFAQQHPSITYIEFAIDSPTAGDYLEERTGISSNCWGHHRPMLRTKSKNNAATGKRKRRKKRNAVTMG